MHKHLSPSEKTNMLADYIEEHTSTTFDMASSAHCAYAFAKLAFNCDHDDNFSSRCNAEVLADLLSIPYDEATALYLSTSLNRGEAVAYIRELGRRVESKQGELELA